ncbi:DUF5680 domain-containing protein [Ottowia testudinis]|uniref:DUF5680 domain-containing protein n=1 Tax=Ottowia testudinis TaxID=2816950 RepID=A0A975H4J5_9BURK|nr:DUF5680 domain-containing protein [Ottowia testudinis]QTD43982.1 hypothetical protein J1M35_12620 [Ottowia testudinis]
MKTASAFLHFLREAKCATYAAQGDAASVPAALSGMRQLEYSKPPYLYRDVYAGFARFAGQETVLSADAPVWSMVYAGGLCGGVADDQATPVFAALRKALLMPPEALPLRGPAMLVMDDMSYTCVTEGDLKRFHGAEQIRRGDQTLYELRFSGGNL